MKGIVISLMAVLLMVSVSCSQSLAPVPATGTIPASPQVPNQAPTPAPAPSPDTSTYTKDWAMNLVSSYLNDLAKSPDAIRYLADLLSQGYFESKFSQSGVDQDVAGHKYSGWQVYYRVTGNPSKEYWGNLNWATFKDGYVTEGSNDALRVKADLLELSGSSSKSSAQPQYKTISFAVKENDQHMFSVYLKKEQTLHLTWLVKEGERVWFYILTPSGKSLGFYKDGQFANGTLEEGACQGFTEGKTIFSPSEFGWREGYYEMLITSYSSTPSKVEVYYWIEDGTGPGSAPSSATTPTPANISQVKTTSDIINDRYTYNGKTVDLPLFPIYSQAAASYSGGDHPPPITLPPNTLLPTFPGQQASIENYYRIKGEG